VIDMDRQKQAKMYNNTIALITSLRYYILKEVARKHKLGDEQRHFQELLNMGQNKLMEMEYIAYKDRLNVDYLVKTLYYIIHYYTSEKTLDAKGFYEDITQIPPSVVEDAILVLQSAALECYVNWGSDPEKCNEFNMVARRCVHIFKDLGLIDERRVIKFDTFVINCRDTLKNTMRMRYMYY
jgi:hypothetical protein